MSFVESSTNIAIGYTVSVTANAIILPVFGLYPSIADNFLIGGCFTLISLARSYIVRRIFNAKNLASRRHEEQE